MPLAQSLTSVEIGVSCLEYQISNFTKEEVAASTRNDNKATSNIENAFKIIASVELVFRSLVGRINKNKQINAQKAIVAAQQMWNDELYIAVLLTNTNNKNDIRVPKLSLTIYVI